MGLCFPWGALEYPLDSACVVCVECYFVRSTVWWYAFDEASCFDCCHVVKSHHLHIVSAQRGALSTPTVHTTDREKEGGQDSLSAIVSLLLHQETMKVGKVKLIRSQPKLLHQLI